MPNKLTLHLCFRNKICLYNANKMPNEIEKKFKNKVNIVTRLLINYVIEYSDRCFEKHRCILKFHAVIYFLRTSEDIY